MKIIELRAENFKRLQAVEIRPDRSVIEVTGRNGAGKSSILDSIWAALGGMPATPSVPIRRGQESASIVLTLGDDKPALKVTRTFRAKDDGGFNHTLLVENEDGFRTTSPQKMLDALVGELSFDPLEFTRLDASKQFDLAKKFVPDFDFDANAKARKDAYNTRTDVNREAKALRAQVDAIVIPEGAATEAVDETALVADLEKAGEHNAEVERQRAARGSYILETGRLCDEAHALGNRIQEMKRQVSILEGQKSTLDERVTERTKKAESAEALPEPIDTAAVRERIEAARSQNAIASRAAQRLELERQALAKEDRSKELSAEVDGHDAEKQKAIAAAKMPVEGLSFGDGEVLLNGVPFDQGSAAEQLRASIAIAEAMNPRLKVIRVRDGALLDDASMQLVADFAEERGLQVWIETVASDRPGAVLIEDGHIAEPAALQAAE